MPTIEQKNTNQSDGVPSAQDWHPADIVAALHKAGWSLTALAHAHGLARSTVFSKAFVYSYPKAEQRIADALGIHPKEIWPSRYEANGERKLRGYRGLSSIKRAPPVNGKENPKNSHETA